LLITESFNLIKGFEPISDSSLNYDGCSLFINLALSSCLTEVIAELGMQQFSRVLDVIVLATEQPGSDVTLNLLNF
jgi:hypothetical protein